LSQPFTQLDSSAPALSMIQPTQADALSRAGLTGYAATFLAQAENKSILPQLLAFSAAQERLDAAAAQMHLERITQPEDRALFDGTFESTCSVCTEQLFAGDDAVVSAGCQKDPPGARSITKVLSASC
jgi:hypothetical protein